MDLGKLGLWAACLLGGNLDFCNLGNLDFGKLEHWVTWTLSNLDFEQFGQLGHWTAWVTWTLDSLGDLDFGKLVNCNYWETCFYLGATWTFGNLGNLDFG